MIQETSVAGQSRCGTWPDTHHQDAIGRLCDSNDLPTAATPHRSALDDTRQIEQLDLSVFVVDGAGDARQGRELISGNFAVNACQFAHECAFAH